MGGSSNALYTSTGTPAAGSAGRSSRLRNEFDLIEIGFEKISLLDLHFAFADLNTAGDEFVLMPSGPANLASAGVILRVMATNNVANTVTETILTAYTGPTGTTLVTGGALTFTSTQVAQSRKQSLPSANNIVNSQDHLRFNTDGGGDSVMPGSAMMEITLL